MGLLKKMSGSEEENRRMIEDERDLVMDDDDLDDSSDDDSDLDGFSPDFKDHIKLTKLKWRSLKPLVPDGYVFWSENAVESQSPPPTTTHSSGGVPNSVPETLMANGTVTDKIRYVIERLISSLDSYNYKCSFLIQLWAARRDGDRCVLTIANQPFGLSKFVNDFYDFRKECLKNKFYVDAKSADEPLVLGQVFRQHELAFTPDIKYYTNEEYPQRYQPQKPVVQGSMAFPIIETSTGCCVGVLEVLCDVRRLQGCFIAAWVILELPVLGLRSSDYFTHGPHDVLGLRSSDYFTHGPHDVNHKTYNQVRQEISKGMKVVCETHKLLLGQVWFPCRCCGDVESGGDCKGQIMSTLPWSGGNYASEANFQEFIISCKDKYLRKGHGVGGRALLSHGPCFCKDVTRFRMTEYPLVHLARMFCLTSCFAICLRSSRIGNAYYVMEFFLPPNKNGGRVPRTLLYSILGTMKDHFPSFKLSSGKELGQELSIEIIKISKDRRPGDSFQIRQITMSTPTLALQNAGDTVQLDSTNQQLMAEADAINNESNVVGPEQNNGVDVIYSENNDRNVAIDSTTEQLMVEAGAINNERNVAIDSTEEQLMVETDAINNERNVAMDSTEQQLMVEIDAMNNEMNVVSLEQNNGHDVIYSENHGSVRTLIEQETEIENQITHDVLRKLFGRPLKDAAEALKVSRSTFKRICRKHGIERWPRCKKTKRNGSLTELNQVNESVHGAAGTVCPTVTFSVVPNALAIPAQPKEPPEEMVIENEGASHDLRNLFPTPIATEACQQGLDLDLHPTAMRMVPGLELDAVISTRPEASVRGAFTLSIGTTLDSGNLSPTKKARLHEWEQKFQRAADDLPENSFSDCHFPTIQPETPIENVVSSRDAESCCPPARDACVEEETAESNSNKYLTLGTTPTLADAINNERNAKDVYRTQSVKPISYVNEFPDGLRPFIQHVEDVTADGNCGFRAIAGLLGLGEDNWQEVRSKLIIELHLYVTHYEKLFGLHMIDNLTRSLSYSRSCINIDRWMIMPEMGHLIASCYDVVLYHLSMHQCLTFLPLRSIPVPTPKRREICIGFVEGNHFVKVFLSPDHPVPPVANKWIEFHDPLASGWDNTYISRIEHFRQIVSPNVATKETIDLD